MEAVALQEACSILLYSRSRTGQMRRSDTTCFCKGVHTDRGRPVEGVLWNNDLVSDSFLRDRNIEHTTMFECQTGTLLSTMRYSVPKTLTNRNGTGGTRRSTTVCRLGAADRKQEDMNMTRTVVKGELE